MHNDTKLLLVFGVSLVAVAVVYDLQVPLTGMITTPTYEVTVGSKVNGKIYLFFNETINTTQVQNIRTEINNIGTTTETTNVQIILYLFNGSLVKKANYTDGTAQLDPGDRKSFNVNFVPPEAGIYVIDVLFPLSTKTIKTSGVFLVFTTTSGGGDGGGGGGSNETGGGGTTTGGTVGSSSGGGGGGGSGITVINENETVIKRIFLPGARMNLTYEGRIYVEQGSSTAASIKVTNIGSEIIHNIRMYASVPNSLSFDINPKQVSRIGFPGDYLNLQETTFIISIDSLEKSQVGEYEIDFEVLSDETVEVGKFVIEVVPPGSLDEDRLRQRIEAYGILINDIENQIQAAHLDGIDVQSANSSLNSAKLGYEKSKIYFGARDFPRTETELKEVRRSLESATLQLASATFFIVKPRELSALEIALIATGVAGAAAGSVVYWKHKMSKRRPRLLRKNDEKAGGKEEV